MTIQWSGWDYGSSGNEGFRIGVEVTVSSVSHSSSSVTFTTKWYVEAMYNVNDSMTVTFGGHISGSDTDNLTTGSSGGTKLWSTKTLTYNYSAGQYGSSPGTRTFTGSLSGVYNGSNPSKSVTVAIPARPYGVPAAPSAVSEVRNSDVQATLTWTRNATTGEPYTSQLIRMRTYTNNAWSAYVDVATVSSTATSYIKTGLSANHLYQFEIRANNTAGSSGFALDSTPYVRMTPAAPINVASVLNSTGASITTTWKDQSYVEVATVTFTVQRSVNGGAYANVATGIAQTGTYGATYSYTDPSPAAGSNRYQVIAVQSVGPLSSAATQGNTITTIVAPLAPTNLQPNGVGVDFARNVTLTWQHNHGGDAAAQSHFRIRYSSNAGSTWTTLANDIASTAQAYTVPAGTLVNGVPYVWQVQTEGILSGGYGPYSASAATTGSTTPTVTLTAPGATVNTLPLQVAWDYNQDELSPETAWEALLLNGAGTTTLETLSGFDASEAATFQTGLVDGTAYQVRVRGRSGAGIWSDWATQAFTFALLPPASGILVATFQPETGSVLLSVTANAPVVGVTVAVDTVIIERRIDGGPWLTLASNLPLPSDFLDVLPITNGLNEYRVTTVSTSPSYSVGAPVLVEPPNALIPGSSGDLQWVLLNMTDDFSALMRFRSEPKISEDGDKEKALHAFAGRKRLVPLFGEQASRVVSVTGKLAYDASRVSPDERLWDSPPEDWTLASRGAQVVCYRDFTGRRIFGTLSGVSVTDEQPGLASVSFTVTETDYTEAEGWVDRDTVLTSHDIIDGGDAFSTDVSYIDGGPA